MLIHLSQLLHFCVPMGGLAVPIVLWVLGKDKNPLVDQHGKNVLNWQISLFIYFVASVAIYVVCSAFSILLTHITGFPFVIGMMLMSPMLIPFLLRILMMVFLTIGAVKANEGTLWKYPLSIPFFK